MASLLNNASLLLNPAGSIIAYEEDKIFSVLPSNGAGDFAFSGGDGGTRVNQQGYIEQTPANLMTYSEVVSSWTGNLFGNWIDSSVTSNSVIAPNGTLTADRIGDGYGRFNASVTATPGQTYTYSVYLKNVSLTSGFYIWYAFGLNGSLNFSAYGQALFIPIASLSTTEWTKFTATVTAPSSGINEVQFGPCPFTSYNLGPTYSSPTYNASGAQLDVWGGMINIGSTAKPYQPTTDRLNYPRITYQNGRGALLSEPQRTNTATYSEDLTNGVWDKTNVSITSNDIISPDGTQNADRVTRTNTSSTYFYNTNTTTSSNRANSIFLKKGTIDQATILGNSYSSGTFATFNLSNGTILSSAGCTPFIEQYKDGWYRCGYIQTNSVSYVLLVTLNGYNNDTVTNGEYLYAWGGQSELGEFPTSYIPTTSATVTRPLDQYSVTNLESKGLTGTNVGTLYLSVANTANSYAGGTINAKVGGGGNFPFNYMILDSTGTANRVRIFNGSTQTGTYFYDGFFSKIAVTADGTNSSVFVNGIKKGTSAGLTAGIEEITQEAIGTGLRYTTATYTTALSDAQCQELTTVRSGSGGTISYYGPYTIHTFTGSATFTPSFNGQVEVLVVAGGGGGGANHGGGGGGAGGLLYTSAYGVSAGSGITVTVGSGGAIAGNGSNSVFGGLTTIGGGLGASEGANNGGNGGSGGGGTGFSTATNGGLGILGQGFDGGKGGFPDTSGVYGSGGGGGGASAPGTDGKEGVDVSGSAGNGGNGLPYSITGFSTYYAGGGGGGYWGSNLAYYGVGGLGGGGNGGAGTSTTLLPTPGVNGLGGGGGGSRGDGSLPRPGSTGGSGIVILRYLT